MPKIKDGFEGEMVISIPDWFIRNFDNNSLVWNLYITRIGFFPGVKFHYVNKEIGTDYNMLIYCTNGEGWYEVNGIRHTVKKNQFFILPKNEPYKFGASTHAPWTIYWLHFKGSVASNFVPKATVPIVIQPNENARLQDRTQIFEEMYLNLDDTFNQESYIYACSCLYHFLASFLYAEQFQKIRTSQKQKPDITESILYYLRENVERKLTLDELSAHFHYSVSHLSALFQKQTNHSPIDYFIRLKIQKACQYLELTNMKMNQIHSRLGFEDAAYFSRVFTKIMGVSPSKYRQNKKIM